MKRRSFLTSGGLAVVGAVPAASALSMSAAALAQRSGNASPEQAGELTATKTVSLAKSVNGEVLGYRRGGIHTFKGIPYAASTAGARRFLPAMAPEPWHRARSSRSYGPICPQDQGNGRMSDEHAFIFQWQDAYMGEDCLRLNVWSPGLDNRKRPVMVWLHGGGFEAGSGHDIAPFDGHNLAQRGDAVVVTINHRLNILGFLDLSAYGDKYAQSGNASLMDIVAALEWVRNSITGFGGDPGRVTIFGQSGGGGKVSMLMGMPAAKGLFHRAIVQSGSFASAQPQENSRKLAALVLEELGIGRSDLARIADVPYATLSQAGLKAVRRAGGGAGPANRFGFGPVADGTVIPAEPWGTTGPAMSVNVPLLVGTTRHEFDNGIGNAEFFAMTEAELLTKTERAFPGKGAAVVAAFRSLDPQAPPAAVSSQISSARFRQAAIDQAAAKAAQGGARAWLYRFDWITPVLDGRPLAFHCAELPFVFDNVSRCATMTGNGARAHVLADSIAGAWIAFARDGDPNHGGLPRWDSFDPAGKPTMLFDDRCRLIRNADTDALATLA